MVKRRKIIRRILLTLLLLGFLGFIYSMGIATYETILANKRIKAFKNRAVFEYEETIEYKGVEQTRYYYKVSRETSYELNDSRSVFYDNSRKYLGQKGDVFLSNKSPFPNIPIIHQWIGLNFGGHSAILDEDNKFIEAVGFPAKGETIFDFILHRGNKPHNFSATVNKTSDNYWLDPTYRRSDDALYDGYYRDTFVGVRVKDITNEETDKALEYVRDKLDINLYNFLFFIDTKYKYYCTDLISRAYEYALKGEEKRNKYPKVLNDDGFITSVNDILLSKYSYITFYVEVIDGIVHIYYLEDI